MSSRVAPAAPQVDLNRIYLARQAIYDRTRNVVAYELLYRAGEDNQALFTNGDRATGQVMFNAVVEIGLEQVIGRETAFINVTPTFLLEGFCETLPKDRVVLEVLEDIEPTVEIIAALERLSAQGYRIALDDFVFHERLRPMVRLASIVKVDVLNLERREIEEHVRQLRQFDVRLLAEKVETHEQFQLCEELGFDYFQGFFVCRPQIIAQRAVPPNRLGMLQLLARLQDERLQVSELEPLISRDPALCFKLLKFINSSYCGLRTKVESIRHAAMLVGLRKIRAWAGLLAYGEFNDKPSELTRTANIRARMCERLGAYLTEQAPERCYTVGLFSLLDAFADQPLETILRQLPLSPEINTAILARLGPAGRILDTVTAYERGDWHTVGALDLPADVVRNAYLDALNWTDSILAQMQD